MWILKFGAFYKKKKKEETLPFGLKSSLSQELQVPGIENVKRPKSGRQIEKV